MKRILYSCFLILSLFLVKKAGAQAISFTVTPFNFCYNGVNSVPAQAAVTSSGVSTSFQFSIAAPAGCAVAPTFTYDPAFPDGSVINTQYDCCGQYTVYLVGFLGASPVQTAVPRNPTGTCVNNLTITPNTPNGGVNSSNICLGQTATLTATGANTYTWAPGPGILPGVNSNPVRVSPVADKCYTVTGTTASGCTVQGTQCVSVQVTSATVTPLSQTTCSNTTLNVSVAASSNSTGVQWFASAGNTSPLGTSTNQPVSSSVAPVSSVIYTAVVTSTGAAGTCTTAATSTLNIAAFNSMTLTASASTACPNNTILLTATPAGATSYTWLAPPAQPSIATASNTRIVTGPGTYTVKGDYGGCLGQTTINIVSGTFTPTLTASSASNCPGQTFTLTGSGGTNYTFTAQNPSGPPSTLQTGTTTSVANTPTFLPRTYSLTGSNSGGCTGATTFTVGKITLHPTIVVSGATNGSVCPNQVFSLTGNGTYTNTFTAPAGIPTGSTSANTSTSSIPSGSFSPVPVYTLTSDSAGCSNFTTTAINRMVLHPILTASSPSVCPGGSFTLTSSIGMSTVTPTTYNFFAPTNVTVTQITPANQATSSVGATSLFPATYTVNVDSLGCQGSGTVSVGLLSLNNQITITSTPTTGLVCPNNLFTLVAHSAQSYTFSAPSGITFTYSPNSPKQDTITSTLPYGANPYLQNSATYTVAGDSMGCIGTQTFTIKQLFSHPHLTVTPSGSVCAGSSVSITASSQSGNSTPTTYTFGFSPPFVTTIPVNVPTPLGTGGTTNNVATHNPTANPTTYYVIADSSGCVSVPGSVTATIGILPPLNVTIIPNTSTVCSGQFDSLYVHSVPGYTYTWFASTNSTIPIPHVSDTAIAVNPTVNTTYTVHAVDPGGCVGTGTAVVNINPTASLTIGASASPGTLCPSTSSTLTATGAVNYTWMPSTSLNTTTSPVVVTSPSATIIYTVKGDNGLGCAGLTTVNVAVVPNPTVLVTTLYSSVCTGYTSTLTATGATSFTWTSDSLPGPVYQPIISVGPGTYSVTGSNGGNCISSTTFSVGHSDPLPISVSPASGQSYTTCIVSNDPKRSHPITLHASGGSSYTWLPYNPASMTYSLGPTTDVSPPASTCYTVTGYTTVCSGKATICIVVVPQFTMNAVPPLPAMCENDSLKLSIVNISTMAVGPASAFTYSWTEPYDETLTLSNVLSPTVTAYPHATSTYSVEMKDSRGCVSIPRLVTVTVYPRPVTAIAIPTINSVPVNTVCYVGTESGTEDDVITLTAANMNVGLPFGVLPTYTWMPPGQYMPNYNPILTPPNNAAVTVKAPLRLPELVTYTVQSGYNGIPGCLRFDTVSVRTIDCRRITDVKVRFITDKAEGDTICARQCVTYTSLTDTAAGGPQRLEWTFIGGNPATSTDPFPTVCYNLASSTPYSVILKVTNPYPKSVDGSPGGSQGSRGIINYMHVTDIPNVTVVSPGGIRSDTTVRFGQSVNLNGSGALSYVWYPGYNITSLTSPSVTVNPFQTTQYVLTGYNSKNCYSADTVNVIVIEDCGEMFVPNAFSPNNDGHNDVLYVRGICLQSLTFMVFNRWGEKVFETTDQKVGWNGEYRGEAENTGVFVYRLEGKKYDGTGFSLKGNITLIR